MNWYRHLLNTALADSRTGNSSATAVLLQQLHADQRDIDRAIQHLQRIQRLRSRRHNQFGTLDLSWTIRAIQTDDNSGTAKGTASGRPSR